MTCVVNTYILSSTEYFCHQMDFLGEIYSAISNNFQKYEKKIVRESDGELLKCYIY